MPLCMSKCGFCSSSIWTIEAKRVARKSSADNEGEKGKREEPTLANEGHS